MPLLVAATLPVLLWSWKACKGALEAFICALPLIAAFCVQVFVPSALATLAATVLCIVTTANIGVYLRKRAVRKVFESFE
ncbi:MAG: hypothetical protein HYZ29_27595 [Myxococcales bacterium]|nr:hypothetical protein [Myxococcales bacterium]